MTERPADEESVEVLVLEAIRALNRLTIKSWKYGYQQSHSVATHAIDNLCNVWIEDYG